MSFLRKAKLFLEMAVVSSATPLFLSMQGTIPGVFQPPGSSLWVLDAHALQEEMEARSIRLEPSLIEEFQKAVDTMRGQEQSEIVKTQDKLVELVESKPLNGSVCAHVDAAVACALNQDWTKASTFIERAEALRGSLRLLEGSQTREDIITSIGDNRAEIDGRSQRKPKRRSTK